MTAQFRRPTEFGRPRESSRLRDVAEAVVAVATADGHLPPVLNVGSGAAVRARDLVSALADLARKPARPSESARLSEAAKPSKPAKCFMRSAAVASAVPVERTTAVVEHSTFDGPAAESSWQQADTTLVQKHLEWSPKIPSEQSLLDTWTVCPSRWRLQLTGRMVRWRSAQLVSLRPTVVLP